MVGNFINYIKNYLKLFSLELIFFLRKFFFIFFKSIIKIKLKLKKNTKFTDTDKKKRNYFFFLYGGIGDHLINRNLIINFTSKNEKTIIFLDKKFSFLSYIYKDSEIVLYEKKKFLKLFFDIRKKINEDYLFVSWSSSIESMLIFILSKSTNFLGIMGNFNFIYNNQNCHKNINKNRYLTNKKIYEYIDYNIFNEKLSLFNNLEKFNNAGDYIVVHPHKTASWGDVSLPENEWIYLINQIIIITNLQVILVGNKNEKIKSEKIYNKIKNKKLITDLTGNTSFHELCTIVKDSKCIISGDTGIMHLGYQLKKHVISIFTFSDPKVYSPPSNSSVLFNKIVSCQPCISVPRVGSDNYPPICLHKYKCSKSIKSNEIINSLLKFLNYPSKKFK